MNVRPKDTLLLPVPMRLCGLLVFVILLVSYVACGNKKKSRFPRPDLKRLLEEDDERISGKFLLYLSVTDTSGRCSPGCQVFEGDSNIHLLNWQAAFKRDTCNRAVSQSRTDHLILRMKRLERLKPERIIFQVGGNNLLQGWEVSKTAVQYRHLVEYYRSIAGEVYCIEVLPVHRSVRETGCGEVRELNREIKKICRETGAEYVPVFRYFYDGRDLADAYRSDPVHLNLKGQIRLAAAVLLSIR